MTIEERLAEAHREIDRLLARIAELEAELAAAKRMTALTIATRSE